MTGGQLREPCPHVGGGGEVGATVAVGANESSSGAQRRLRQLSPSVQRAAADTRHCDRHRPLRPTTSLRRRAYTQRPGVTKDVLLALDWQRIGSAVAHC